MIAYIGLTEIQKSNFSSILFQGVDKLLNQIPCIFSSCRENSIILLFCYVDEISQSNHACNVSQTSILSAQQSSSKNF
mgnify:CR=1 FL=1